MIGVSDLLLGEGLLIATFRMAFTMAIPPRRIMKYRDQKKNSARSFAALLVLASLVLFLFASTLAGSSRSTVVAFAAARFPLQRGEAALTCASGFNGSTPQPFVVAILDIRNPDCNAP